MNQEESVLIEEAINFSENIDIKATATHDASGRKIIKRYEHSPFSPKTMVIPKKGKAIKIASSLGKNKDIALINTASGEEFETHISTYRTVDSDRFIKIFTQNIKMIFDLSATGIKAFNVLLFAMQYQSRDNDIVDLDKLTLEDFVKETNKNMSLATFYRGLNELENNQIIAKHLRKGRYFINPHFVFNGDRIAFTTVLMRERNEKLKDD